MFIIIVNFLTIKTVGMLPALCLVVTYILIEKGCLIAYTYRMNTPIQSRNIFLADDDDDDRILFVDALADIDINTQLTIAKDGLELMKFLEIKVPPLPYVIFLDLNMPRKNGFECLQEIREADKLKKIPVVVFSTSDSAVAINTTYLLGANLFVRKPSSFSLLKRVIQTIIDTDLNQKVTKDTYLL